MTFHDGSHVVASFSDDFEVVQQAINRILEFRFSGGTHIQDGVYDATKELISYGNRDRSRRAVLVITDNLGLPAHHKAQILESLWEADALLSGLVVPNRTAL
jgi:hypothetical protein